MKKRSVVYLKPRFSHVLQSLEPCAGTQPEGFVLKGTCPCWEQPPHASLTPSAADEKAELPRVAGSEPEQYLPLYSYTWAELLSEGPGTL